MNHFNRLTPAEDERLALLAEECSEVIQAVTKIQRHGYESFNPNYPLSSSNPTNRGSLAKEIGHVYHAVDRMLKATDFVQEAVDLSSREKSETIGRYLHHQGMSSEDAA